MFPIHGDLNRSKTNVLPNSNRFLESFRNSQSVRDMYFSKVLFKYLAQGISLNALGYILYSVLVYFSVVESILVAALVSSLMLLPISFAANRKWVFESNNPMAGEVTRFFFVYAFSVALNLLLLWAVSIAVKNPFLAQAISSCVVVMTTFLLNNIWTFKK